MKQANVSELKAHLSEYLARVRRGESLTVYDRQTPIARLVPLDQPTGDFEIEEAAAPGSPLRGLPRITLQQPVNLDALLRDERGER